MIGGQEPARGVGPLEEGPESRPPVNHVAEVLAPVAAEVATSFLDLDPDGWTDVLTGCDGPRFWDRVISSEQARNLRHERTATIALIEFAGIEVAAQRWGQDLARQLFQRLARVLASEIRSSDHIARIGQTRFAVLLVETDEILAINFVDRIRHRCASEIDPELHGFRIGIGWASPAVGGSLREAQRLAAERLQAELAQQV
jgi:diguanylate cyclase (GGDEF)-like protein